MRVELSVGVLALAACGGAGSAPAPAPADSPSLSLSPPADAAVLPDAAPPRFYLRSDGFDFRAVPLDPSLVGSDQLCIVEIVSAESVWCESDRAETEIALATNELVPHERDVLRVHIVDATHATVVEKVGVVRPPPPLSRCDCEPRHDPREPKPPRGYDFSRVDRDHAWGTSRLCEVTGLGRPRAAPAGVFDPSVAAFVDDVVCGGTGVLVGALGYQPLLELHTGDIIELELYSTNGQLSALYRAIPHRYEPSSD